MIPPAIGLEGIKSIYDYKRRDKPVQQLADHKEHGGRPDAVKGNVETVVI